MHIKAVFPKMSTGKLFSSTEVRQLDGDLIRWTNSLIWQGMVEKVIMGYANKSHQVEGGVPQFSSLSPSLFGIDHSGLIKWVEENGAARGLYLIDDIG
jgi:hypothetical protein